MACAAPGPEDHVAARLEELRMARVGLADARSGLATAQASGDDAVNAPRRLVEARESFDQAYRRYQSLLAAFLENALTERPRVASTRDALSWYTDEAVVNARETLARGGEPRKVERSLANVARYHDLAGVPLPPRLLDARSAARQAARERAIPTPPLGDR